ncbi:MAG TPA: mechanosensitive ion channel domain-containing protein [Candidatus Acidoferrales bacterium]|jgi:small-conductance mechanosensitive channel|nr:mechanosensitive ion channel domain-containing protein [Candidatus Acidoferrales bacterium]
MTFSLSLAVEPHSLFDLLDSSARRVLDWPLFSIGNMPVTLLFLIKCILFLVALSLLTRVSRWILGNKILSRTKMDPGVQYAFLRAFGYVIFLLGLIIGLDTSGLNLRSLLVVGGALGLGVGLGLQNIVANFVAGLVILWEGPVKVGDLIEVGNTQGEVIRIGARGTWVRTFDNQVIIVPNSEFVNQRVSNWTANDRVVRLSIPVGVSYNCDLDQVRQMLLEIANRHPEVLPSPPPMAIVTGFGDSSVNLVLRVSTGLLTDRAPTIKSDLFFDIFRVFREKNIEIPFPQRDLHIRSADAPMALAHQTAAS